MIFSRAVFINLRKHVFYDFVKNVNTCWNTFLPTTYDDTNLIMILIIHFVYSVLKYTTQGRFLPEADRHCRWKYMDILCSPSDIYLHASSWGWNQNSLRDKMFEHILFYECFIQSTFTSSVKSWSTCRSPGRATTLVRLLRLRCSALLWCGLLLPLVNGLPVLNTGSFRTFIVLLSLIAWVGWDGCSDHLWSNWWDSFVFVLFFSF